MTQAYELIESLKYTFNVHEMFKMNVASVPVAKAKEFAAKVFDEAGKDIDKELPDFEKNYMMVQKATKAAPDIPRIEMPVIEPHNIDQFEKDIKAGRIDIFKPFAFKGQQFPTDLLGNAEKSAEFLSLGQKDGKESDDRLKAKIEMIPAKSLKPTQSQIWLEKLATNIAKFGKPKAGSSVTNATIIVSKNNYLLDGHHRWSQALLADPKLKIRALKVPLDIDTLLKMGRSYGNAVGNAQKQ